MHYTTLQSLPDELILFIFQYIKQENHLDLIPISSCCRRFQRLASDYQLWNKMVMMDSSIMSSGNNMIRLPLSLSHRKYQAREIVVIDPSDIITRGLQSLLRQNDPSRPLDLSIFTNNPLNYWNLLANKTNLFRSISILPTQQTSSSLSHHHHHFNNSDNIHSVDPSMYDFFEKMHPYLELLAFPRLSLHKLINIKSKKLIFPQIHTLNIGLSSLKDTGDSVIDWSKVKYTFPNLQDLTLHPLSIDKKEFWSIIRSLWSAPATLFPWLHSITIEANAFSSSSSSSSSMPPLISSTNNITKDEITITLSRLKGLTRINTGTLDIVAVDQL